MVQRAKFEQIPAYGGKRTETIPSTNVVSGTQGLEAISKGLFDLSESLDKRNADRAVAAAASVGIKAGASGNVQMQDPGTLAGASYNRAALSTYLSDLETKAQSNIDMLSQQHRADPAQLQTALAAYRNGITENLNNTLPDMVPSFNQLFERNSRPAVMHAFAEQNNIVKAENQGKFIQYADSAINGAQRIARAIGIDPQAQDNLAIERERFINRMLDNGPPGNFEFSGHKMTADASRPDALSPEKMAELLSKYDDTMYTQTVMGKFERAPNKMNFYQDFVASEKDNKNSPLSIEQVTRLSASMHEQILRSTAEEDRLYTLEKRRKADVEEKTWNGMLLQMDKPNMGGLTYSAIVQNPDLTPQVKEHLQALLKTRLEKPFTATNPAVFLDVQKKINLPEGDPNKITDTGVIFKLYSVNNQLSWDDTKDLLNTIEINKKYDPTQAARQKLSDHVLDIFKRSIVGAVPGPDGINMSDSAAYHWNQDAKASVDKKVLAGEDPATLFDPNSKEFLGTPERVGKYLFTAKQAVTQQAEAIRNNPPVKIAGDEDFAKLPPGAFFIGPDGVTRQKPGTTIAPAVNTPAMRTQTEKSLEIAFGYIKSMPRSASVTIDAPSKSALSKFKNDIFPSREAAQQAIRDALAGAK